MKMSKNTVLEKTFLKYDFVFDYLFLFFVSFTQVSYRQFYDKAKTKVELSAKY